MSRQSLLHHTVVRRRCPECRRIIFGVLFCLASLAPAGTAVAQQPAVLQENPLAQILPPSPSFPMPPAPSSPIRSAAAAERSASQPAPHRLHVLVGRSLVITSALPLKRVSIADPATAEAVLISSTQILVNGKMPGDVSLVLWNEAEETQAYEVEVDLDLLNLRQRVHDLFPDDSVHLSASKDVVMVSGRMASKEAADSVMQLVTAITPKVVNLLEVPAKPQHSEILLEVRFAELDRTALSQFGFNLLSLPGSTTRTLAVVGTQQFGATALQSLQSGGTAAENTSNLTLSDLLNIFIFRPDINLGAVIKALQQKNLLQILAEPNLLTETGKEASFLAGGEFPFPVVQGGAAGSVPTVTIQFKEFGVKLNFKPDVTAQGTIHLHVNPEVSALDFTNAVNFAGFFIPAISTRRVDTEVELIDGQSFAIAGLVDDRVTKVLSKIPGLGDAPVLGPLFRSHNFNKTKTELLIVVTPHIVQPLPPGTKLPGPEFPEPFLAPLKPPVDKQSPAKP